MENVMGEASTPPPPSASTLGLAAGAGGFVGAVLGVIVASGMMGNGDDNNRSAIQEAAPEAQVAIVDHE